MGTPQRPPELSPDETEGEEEEGKVRLRERTAC